MSVLFPVRVRNSIIYRSALSICLIKHRGVCSRRLHFDRPSQTFVIRQTADHRHPPLSPFEEVRFRNFRSTTHAHVFTGLVRKSKDMRKEVYVKLAIIFITLYACVSYICYSFYTKICCCCCFCCFCCCCLFVNNPNKFPGDFVYFWVSTPLHSVLLYL